MKGRQRKTGFWLIPQMLGNQELSNGLTRWWLEFFYPSYYMLCPSVGLSKKLELGAELWIKSKYSILPAGIPHKMCLNCCPKHSTKMIPEQFLVLNMTENEENTNHCEYPIFLKLQKTKHCRIQNRSETLQELTKLKKCS